ncbi:hypothetical protein MPSEU_000977900 [Mayamaea pseudoterrestris]|nr:hypothetical protein MPSEU_000977900 [Mayamaea pseudoterrestris]
MARTIDSVVPAKTSGQLSRLIGTVDIDGNGTQHSLTQVDPFIVLDKAVISKNKFPPFGSHPHSGHSVVTLLLKGKLESWDSISNETMILQGPASYFVDAGTGLFHDERSVIEDENDDAQQVHLLQLWMGVTHDKRLLPPRVQYETNLSAVPLHNDSDETAIGSIMYYVGGPSNSIETPHLIQVSVVHQIPNTTYRHDIDANHGGFIVNLNDDSVKAQASFGGISPTGQNDVLVMSLSGTKEASSSPSYLEITTSPEAAADYLIATGERIQEPWVKLLVADGAVIAATEGQARAKAKEMAQASVNGKGVAGGSYAPFGV